MQRAQFTVNVLRSRKMFIQRCVAVMALGAGGALCAQDYPSKPIRILTNEPGSSSEVTARAIAQGISGLLGQSVVVDARPGGGNIIGEMVEKAPADGYTLLSVGSSFWIGPLFRKAPFDAMKDFAPITISISSP